MQTLWRPLTLLQLLAVMSCIALPATVASQWSDVNQELTATEVENAPQLTIAELLSTSVSPAEYEEKPSIEHIVALVERGTYQLAYQLIVDARAEYENTADWMEWETQFLELAWQLDKWDDLIERAAQLQGLEGFLTTQIYAAKAEIKLQQHEQALQRIRTILLQLPVERQTLIELRRAIAQVYLEQGNLFDAEIALRLFDRDYRPSEPKWEHRFIRVLLQRGKWDEAHTRLAPLQTLEAQLLKLHTEFRSRARSPSATVLKGLEIESQFNSEPHLHAELWALIEVAARSYNDFEIQIKAIETELSIDYDPQSRWEHLPVVDLHTETQLLEIYAQAALFVGNDIGLMVGDDVSWYQLAQEFEITSPVIARALHAYLARNSYAAEFRNQSMAALATLLFDAGYYGLLEHFFVNTNMLDLSSVPYEIQSRLANVALRKKDFDKALTIINVMPPPEDAGQLESWWLTQARIAISISQFERGEQLLNRALEQLTPTTDQQNIDRLIQVIFDLQEQNQHALAVQMFVKLYGMISALQSQREILRWIGESYSALSDFTSAADYLIRSAALGGQWDDEWALSARLQAGDELVKAKFMRDAQVIYQQLHDDILDPRNQALIADRLRELPQSGVTDLE